MMADDYDYNDDENNNNNNKSIRIQHQQQNSNNKNNNDNDIRYNFRYIFHSLENQKKKNRKGRAQPPEPMHLQTRPWTRQSQPSSAPPAAGSSPSDPLRKFLRPEPQPLLCPPSATALVGRLKEASTSREILRELLSLREWEDLGLCPLLAAAAGALGTGTRSDKGRRTGRGRTRRIPESNPGRRREEPSMPNASWYLGRHGTRVLTMELFLEKIGFGIGHGIISGRSWSQSRNYF